MLAVLYGLYAFGYALFNPKEAPAVEFGESSGEAITRGEGLRWFLAVPAGLIAAVILLGQVNFIGNQDVTVDSFSDAGKTASLRTNVSEECRAAMIDLHGQLAWDTALAEQAAIDEAGGVAEARALSEDERAALRADKIAAAAPIGSGIAIGFLMLALVITTARGVSPSADRTPLMAGAAGVVLALAVDAILISPITTPGWTLIYLALPLALTLYGVRYAAGLLGKNDLLRVVFPPLVLIIAVLGSILGGITNPTPAAALGAGGAIMLAAYRKLQDQDRSGALIIWSTFAVIIMILVGVNFDLRVNQSDVATEDLIAFFVAKGAYLFAMFGLLYGCWVLLRGKVLTPIVRETAKVTSMVFTILIGSQLLNLVVISFGGEHYIQQFLQSFDNEFKVFLIVMLVLFVMGFVLDFLEIIYIVIPIVGPVIYGGTFDPKWVTIMIAVNLQTSFLTPPFGFALFYLRGVAPKEVTTGHIYKGIIPFVLIQVVGLAILWYFPSIVTILPDLLAG
jgi:TRAP-type mannitol/chloroaromatic compound transport system permease large subunit